MDAVLIGCGGIRTLDVDLGPAGQSHQPGSAVQPEEQRTSWLVLFQYKMSITSVIKAGGGAAARRAEAAQRCSKGQQSVHAGMCACACVCMYACARRTAGTVLTTDWTGDPSCRPCSAWTSLQQSGWLRAQQEAALARSCAEREDRDQYRDLDLHQDGTRSFCVHQAICGGGFAKVRLVSSL